MIVIIMLWLKSGGWGRDNTDLDSKERGAEVTQQEEISC